MIKSPLQAGRRGIEVLLQKGGHETGALECLGECWSWGQLSVQLHTGTPMTTHRLEPCHFKPSIPKLFLFSSLDQVSEGCVVRELRPCSELVTMSRKVESEVELARVLGEVARLGTSSNQEI